MKLIQINAWYWRTYWPVRRFFERERPDFILAQESVDAPDHGFDADYHSASRIRAEGLMAHALQADAPFDSRYGVPRRMGQGVFAQTPLTQAGTLSLFTPEQIAADAKLAHHTLLHATTVVAGRTLHLVSYHNRLQIDLSVPGEGRLGSGDTDRRFRLIGDYLDTIDGPLILSGDFNLWPAAPALKLLPGHLRNLVTMDDMPHGRNAFAWKTDEIVSHMFVSEEIKVRDFRIAPDLVSDHQPLVLEFEL